MKRVVVLLLIFLGLTLFFSYGLTKIPDGITVDEASFGYNGSLLARTLRDENGRKLPVFVLSLGGTDWRQPITQYVTAFIFRIFGPSLFNLRLTAVMFAVASIVFIFFLGKNLLGNIGGVVASVFLATTPIVMIQSHLGLDNIAPIPFIIIWLWGLILFTKSKKNYWLVLSAISLGISYYSYKSMRIFVPVWAILSLVYLSESFLTKISKNNFKNILKPVLFFSISIAPFFAVIPLLEFLYAGAVLNRATVEINNLYVFIGNYLSTFDPSFLFVSGDTFLFHSTGRHGMFLLMSLPFFIVGLINSWKKSSLWKLIIVSFFLGPLMFGYIGQIHRASRLMALIPLYSLISSVGFLTLWQKKVKIAVVTLMLLFAINYFDFIYYYLGDYAKDTKNIFNCFECIDIPFEKLKEESIARNLTPYVDYVTMKGLNPTRDFAETVNFEKRLNIWDGKKENLPVNFILMTDNSDIDYLKQIDRYGRYYFYIK